MRDADGGAITSSIIPAHLLSTRRSWLYLIVAAVGIWAIVDGARTIGRMREASAPGTYFNRRNEVVPPQFDARLEPGDRIVSIGDVSVDTAASLTDQANQFAPGEPVRLGFVRDGERREISVQAFAPSITSAILRFASGALMVCIGLLVFWFHPGRRESWPFLFGSVAFGVTLLCTFGMPRTTQSLFASRVGAGAAALIGPFFLHLFAVFPRPLRSIVRRPWLPAAGELAAVALAVTTGLAVTSTAAREVVVRLSAGSNLACTFAALGIVIWRLRRPVPREDLTRLRALVLAAFLAFLVPALFALTQAFRLWIPASEWPSRGSSLFMLCFPVVVGGAILRRDLFDIDRAVARAATASALVGVISLVFGAAAIAIPQLLAPDMLGSPLAAAIAAVLAVVALWPVVQRVQQRLLASFDGAPRAEQLGHVRDAVAALAEDPTPPQFGRLERRIEEAFALPDAALLVRDDQGWQRPSTGERVEIETWPHAIELRRDDAVVGAVALGRPGRSVALSAAATTTLDDVAVDVARALRVSRRGDAVGDYRIERFLAAGGMGNVYLATKVGAAGFEKPVAIKQLLPEIATDAESVERFLNEARLVARLSHPGIVQTLELGESERGYFIVMEYIDGIDASTLLRRLNGEHQKLPLPVACHIVTSACLALEHAHRATDENGAPLRLVHHDVSPHNLLIDRDGNVKLADFGVAHVRQAPARRDQLVGKVGYMAPEQLRHEPLDHRVDVFAAGIVLFELVTGQHPFAAGSDFMTFDAIEQGRFLPPETIREDCPLGLALIIERALAPEPARRYPTSAALAEAIQAVFSLDSRHAVELGRLVTGIRNVGTTGVHAPAAMTLPTRRG